MGLILVAAPGVGDSVDTELDITEDVSSSSQEFPSASFSASHLITSTVEAECEGSILGVRGRCTTEASSISSTETSGVSTTDDVSNTVESGRPMAKCGITDSWPTSVLPSDDLTAEDDELLLNVSAGL